MEDAGPCKYSGCRLTAQFNSDFCSEHQNEVSHISTNSDEVSSHDGSRISNQVIRFEIDGNKKTIDSKDIEHLLKRLKGAKKFWIVDLTIHENEFVQYAIEKGELEHWDKLEMIESKEMTAEEAFSTVRTKITGDYSGHLMWWSDQPAESPSEEELDEQGKKHVLFAIGILLVTIIGVLVISDGDPMYLLSNFAGEALCQFLCFPIALLGGAGASNMGRSESGKFTK